MLRAHAVASESTAAPLPQRLRAPVARLERADDVAVAQRAHRADRVRQPPAEEPYRIADAEDVVARGAVHGVQRHGVQRLAGRRRLCQALVGQVARRDQPGRRVLPGGEPADQVRRFEARRRSVEQQVGDLDGVGPRADCGLERPRERGGPVDEPAVLEAAGEQVAGLCAGPAREGPQLRGKVCGEVRGRVVAGVRPAVAQDARRVARDDRPVGHVLRDDGAGADDDVVTDRDAVEDRGVRADPDVVPERDALAPGALLVDRPVGGHAVVEPEDRRVRADPDAVAHPDLAADHRVGVDRAVGADRQVARHVGERRDVACGRPP